MNSAPPRTHRNGLTDTGIRFALLMTVVTASSISMLDTALAPEPNDTPGDALGCLLAAGIDPDGRHLDNMTVGGSRPEAMRECLSAVPTVENWKGLVTTLVLLAVAALTYWWLPRWRELRRRTLAVETVDRDGALAAELAELRELAGIGHRVRFRIDPERTSAGAVVYGRFGRYTVCLHAGLLALRGSDRDGFRAVVLHEFAHVRNRDVDFAYSSTALWRAFVLLALLPYLFQQGSMLVDGLLGRSDSPFWPGAASMIAYSLLSGLLLVALVHLTRADLLRRRELHADAQAVFWGADASAWGHRDPRTRVAALLRRVTALLRTHPDWAERRGVLADPARLSDVGAPQMFLTGVAGTLLLNASTAVPAGTMGSAWLTAAFVAPLLVIVLRRSVLRSDPAAGDRTESGAAAGLWLGCGLMVGEFVRGGNSGNEWLVAEPWYMLLFLAVGAVPAVWSAQSMRLELALGRRGLRTAAALLNGLVTLVLVWGGLRWWQQWGQYQAMGVTSQTGTYRRLVTQSFPGPWQDYGWELSTAANSFPPLFTLNGNVLLAVTVAVMVLFPLLLHLGAGRTTLRLRLRRTLWAGVSGGILCLTAFAAGSYVLHAGRPDSGQERYTAAFLYVNALWLLIILMAVCLLTAAVVAAVSRRHWLLRGMLAAQVVQLTGYAAVFLLISADGCFGPLNRVAVRCHWLPESGWTITELIVAQSLTATILLSAFAALTGAGIGRTVRRYRQTRTATAGNAAAPPAGRGPDAKDPESAGSAAPQPDLAPHAARVWPSRLRRGAALALCLPVLLLTVSAQSGKAQSWQGKASSSSAAEQRSTAEQRFGALLDTPATARGAKIREWQALAWLTKGGLTRIKRINDAYVQLSDALIEMAEQKPGPNGKIKLDGDELGRLCGTLGRRAKEADSYFAMPDRDLQKRWSGTLRRLVSGSGDCVSGVGEGKGTKKQSDAERDRLLKRFLEDSPRLMQELGRILDDISRVATTSSKSSSRGR